MSCDAMLYEEGPVRRGLPVFLGLFSDRASGGAGGWSEKAARRSVKVERVWTEVGKLAEAEGVPVVKGYHDDLPPDR